MAKKHLILRDIQTEPREYIEGFEESSHLFSETICSFDELERLAVTEEVQGGLILLMPQWSHKVDLQILREKFPGIKIILSCKQIKPEALMTLQYEKKLVDLFMKPLFDINKYTEMLDSLTAEATQTTTVVQEAPTSEVEDSGGIELNISDDEEEDSSENSLDEATTKVDITDFNEGGIELNIDEDEDESVEDDNGNEDDEDAERELSENSTFVRKLSSFTQSDNDEDVVDLAMELEGIDSIMGVTEVRAEEQTLITSISSKKEKVLEEGVQFVKDEPIQKINEHKVVKVEESAGKYQELLDHKNLEIQKVLLRNEVLEAENKSLHQKIIHLEDITARSQMNSKENQIAVDENNVKLKILRKRHREELSEQKGKVEVLREQLQAISISHENLKKNHFSIERDKVIDLKVVKKREDDLSEKIELMEKDFSSQLSHREKRISELKSKIDLLEFDFKKSGERETDYRDKIEYLEQRLFKLKKFLGESLDQMDEFEGVSMSLLKKAK